MASEWQPARLRKAHERLPNAKVGVVQDAKPYMSRIVRVRETEANSIILESKRNSGCDGKIFLEVHPDDTLSVDRSRGKLVVCEHEVLTD